MSAMVTSTAKTEAFMATGVNSGTITTHGDGSKGASIRSDVSSDDTSEVSVTNSGTVTTNGDNAEGIEAVIQYEHDTDSTDAPGTVMATNSGTVTTNGDQTGTANRLSGAVQATFENLAGTTGTIQNSGNAVVENTGTVNALGRQFSGSAGEDIRIRQINDHCGRTERSMPVMRATPMRTLRLTRNSALASMVMRIQTTPGVRMSTLMLM